VDQSILNQRTTISISRAVQSCSNELD